MFTGLIEAVGEVVDISPIRSGYRVRIAVPIARDLRLGESISVNGVCLTVVGADESRSCFLAEIGPETARVTSLGALRSGSLVNIERPMSAQARFGGHLVLGHVDATGTVQSLRPDADFTWLTIGYPANLAPLLIPRGSVAVDGISLTIAKLDPAAFDVQIVPFTWTHTNLRNLSVGDPVNLECDMVGKYVIRAMETMGTKV